MLHTENYSILERDADLNDIVRPSSVLKYMQETANRQMKLCGPSYSELFQKGMAFILSRITVVYYDQLHAYDKISVQSWPSESKGLSFPRFYRIIKDGKVMMEGASSWALLDMNNHRLMRASEIDLSNYPFGDPLDISLRFRMPNDALFEEVKTHTVEYSEIDCNRHMNNTNYPDMLCNRIPQIENKEIKEFSINFLSEAPYNQNLKIFRNESEDENRDTVYYFKTLKDDITNIEAKIITKDK